MPQNAYREAYEEILHAAQVDDDVLGFILAGSRGKGLVHDESDYDCIMIVKDQAFNAYKERYKKHIVAAGTNPQDGIDLLLFKLDDFRAYALLGSPTEWDRYNFAHLVASVDKCDGEIQRLIEEKFRIPEDRVKQKISGALNWYVNQVHCSLKELKRNNMYAYKFEAATSMHGLLMALFYLHGRRTAPYFKYLQWELDQEPFDKFPMDESELIHKLMIILETADYRIQLELFREMEVLFRQEGYAHIFDDLRAQRIRELDLPDDLRTSSIIVGKGGYTVEALEKEVQRLQNRCNTMSQEGSKKHKALERQRDNLDSRLEAALQWKEKVEKSRSYRLARRISGLYSKFR